MGNLKTLRVWNDDQFRDCALQMAIDECLFSETIRTSAAHLRFYRWDRPERTVGYFHRTTSHESDAPQFVRRYTGGGIVDHGEDLTFALCIPACASLAQLASHLRYRWIHEQFQKSLKAAGAKISLVATPLLPASASCFEAPVAWDLVSEESGEKVGGGAQRRSKGAVIHQGSIRLSPQFRSPSASWLRSLISLLAADSKELETNEKEKLEHDAYILRADKYALDSWNFRL